MVFTLTACENHSVSTSDCQTSSSVTSKEVAKSETPSVESSEKTTTEPSQKAIKDTNEGNILIAYFSRAGENYNVGNIEKGNTQIIAEMIAEQTGGTLFHIQTVKPYPEDYKECTNVAQQEKKDNARPKLDGEVKNMKDYDVVFLGYPIWWGDMPMVVYTFLKSYDFSGKTIVPFCTHEGSGLSGTVKNISNKCSGAKVLEGLDVMGKTAQKEQDNASKDVKKWLSKNGFIK